jgi:hypothetical protein
MPDRVGDGPSKDWREEKTQDREHDDGFGTELTGSDHGAVTIVSFWPKSGGSRPRCRHSEQKTSGGSRKVVNGQTTLFTFS